MSWLISFEGIDGSGKSSLIKNLKKKADSNLITHSWRDTELGKKIWSLLDEARGKKENSLPSNWSYIFLILVAFDKLIKKIIRPNLQENKIVIIDRYIDSTFVYQGLEGNIKIDAIQEIAQKTINLPLPDITFVLDVEPKKARERLEKRKAETKEYTNWDNLKLDFHQRIRSNYLKLKKIFPERIYVINANKSEDEVVEEVWELIKQVCHPKENLPQFVRVIIYNEKGEILLVEDKKWGWNLPGGKIEENETPEEAAKREVWEETNLVVENLEKVGGKNVFYANLEKGNQHWKGYFYQASQYSGEIRIKETEKILAIKFVDINYFSGVNDNQHSWKFYLEKIRDHE